ncbi:MAG TPA: YceI family protein [Tepidisphaeraceae bacterium]|nr:YceI family protein [Tepidisphaeraceae bacterium]
MRSASLVAVLALVITAPAASAADDYLIDPVHSVIIFRIKHGDVGYFYGRFNMPQGQFKWDEQNPPASSFTASVKASDFDSGNAKRDQHVEGPDFLNAKEFPNVTFKSKSVKAGDGDGKYVIEGELSMHGQTKPVTMALEKTGQSKDRIGFEGVMDINKKDFSITGVQGVSDEIRLIAAFQGVRPKQ